MTPSWFLTFRQRWMRFFSGAKRLPVRALRPRCENLEDRTLFATDTWTNSLGGAWATGSN
jgi:hypothetical protein